MPIPVGGGLEFLGGWHRQAARHLQNQLNTSMQAFRQGALTGQHRLRAVKLDAFAEFAAGAGHELNKTRSP